MKIEKQLKTDKYNIFKFIKYVCDRERNFDIIVFNAKEYDYNTINEIFKKGIEYHNFFENRKFNVWLLFNRKRLKENIVYIRIEQLNKKTKKNIEKIRKYSREIIIECDKHINFDEAKRYSKNFGSNVIVGYTNYHDINLRRIIILLGYNFEYKKITNTVKTLAIIHTFNEEDVIEHTMRYLINQGIDICVLDNWSTDCTFEIAKKIKEEFPNRIIVRKFPEEKSKDNNYFEWEKQLKETERISRELNYDWYIHYDSDEIRRAPFDNVTLSEMIAYVDSLGYNAIDTTVLDFRLTDKKENIFAQNTYFELGRRPSCFMQIKTWKKCEDIDLASTGGHLAKFKNQKVYPLKIINRHYSLRSLEQAKRKVFRDRLPRFEKEKKEKGWHTHYDKIIDDNSFIYEIENLNLYTDDIVERITLEMISGIGIDKI